MRARACVAALAAGALLVGIAATAMAVPPDPIRDGARFTGVSCPNPAGARDTHGSYVSGVVLFGYPTDPIFPDNDDWQDCAPA